jgi:hypothetical protein
MTAVNSYTVLGFAAEMLAYEPDAVLVYTGCINKSLGMNLRRRHKRRLPERVKLPLEQPKSTNPSWSMG